MLALKIIEIVYIKFNGGSQSMSSILLTVTSITPGDARGYFRGCDQAIK